MNPATYVSSFFHLLAFPGRLLDHLLGLAPGAGLAQAALVSLALLAAFLTVVQVWQIPPPSRRLAGGTAVVGESALPPIEPDQPKAFAANLLSNNFSRTVLGGLVGLTAVTFLDSFFKESGFKDLNVKAYYLVLFVAFFLALLLLSAVFRGLVEAGRSRIISSRQVAAWPRPINYDGMSGPVWFGRWAGFWVRRGWYWLASFRTTLLVFSDTFFNVIQGKNQLQAAVLSDTVIDLHEALVEAAERTRDEVHEAVVGCLGRKGILPSDQPHEDCVRVAVSLLAKDDSKVYYVTRERGSMDKTFPPGSVAWIAAHATEARWYKSGPVVDEKGASTGRKWNDIYLENRDAVVFNNQRGELPGLPAEILLSQAYEHRGSEDYEAFVVLPMPWTCRGGSGAHRRGAIHISFRKAAYMDAFWGNLETPDQKKPNYDGWHGLLVPAADRSAAADGEVFLKIPEGREVGRVLHQALEVLGEALGHFDDEVFNEYVQLRRHM